MKQPTVFPFRQVDSFPVRNAGAFGSIAPPASRKSVLQGSGWMFE